jgi:hypothetical protein
MVRGRVEMAPANKASWIVRVTLDVYLQSIAQKCIGGSKNTLSRLKKFSRGDEGVFYISTPALESGRRICEFRQPFKVTGSVQPVPVEVRTWPKEKHLAYSVPINLRPHPTSVHISGLIHRLDFIRRKELCGSYLIQAFICISAKDFEAIVEALKTRSSVK